MRGALSAISMWFVSSNAFRIRLIVGASVVEFKFVPWCRFVAGKDRHSSSHPSRALAPVCIDLDCMIIGAVGYYNVFKFNRVRQSVDFDLLIDVLCALSVSFPDVVAPGCFLSFDCDRCGSSQYA